MSDSIARRDAGFTLMEVIVVMTLITILSAVSIISLAFYIPNLHLKTAAQEINIQIQKARLEGIRRSKTIAVRFFVTDISGTQKYAPIIWVDDNKDNTLDAGEEVLFRMPANEFATNKWETVNIKNVRFNPDIDGDGLDDAEPDGVTFTNNQFSLNSRGISTQAGSIFLVNPRGGTRQVMVTLGGAVRVY